MSNDEKTGAQTSFLTSGDQPSVLRHSYSRLSRLSAKTNTASFEGVGGPHQRAGPSCWWSLTFLWLKSLTLGQVLESLVARVIASAPWLLFFSLLAFYQEMFWKMLWLMFIDRAKGYKKPQHSNYLISQKFLCYWI